MDSNAFLSLASPGNDFQEEFVIIPEEPVIPHQQNLRKIEDIIPDGAYTSAPTVIVNGWMTEKRMRFEPTGIDESFFTFLLMSKLQKLETEQIEAEKIMKLLEGAEIEATKS